MAKTKTAAPLLELPVAYGNVNLGDEIARVSISMNRSAISLSSADRQLLGKRLIGRIVARAGDAQAEQESLPGLADDISLEGAFDVHSLGVSKKRITTGLSFNIASIDVSVLAHFAKRQGILVVSEIGEIPDDEGDGNGNGNDAE